MTILSFCLFIDPLAWIAQIVSREQHVYRSGVVANRQSAERAAQCRDQDGQREVAGLPPKRFRERSDEPQPSTRLPDFGARRRSVVEFGISACHQALEILS